MTAIVIKTFDGLLPARGKRLIGPQGAQEAVDTRLDNGKLRAWYGPVKFTGPCNPSSAYAEGPGAGGGGGGGGPGPDDGNGNPLETFNLGMGLEETVIHNETETTTYPYLWVGARFRWEDVGGSWWDGTDNALYDSTLILEVFEPELAPANDSPTYGTTNQFHVSTWHFQEFWFPHREHWRNPSWANGWAYGDPSLRWPNNPGIWAWMKEFYAETDFENHPANGGTFDPFWISYTDRFMYLTSGSQHLEYNDPDVTFVEEDGRMVPVPLWIARDPKPGGPAGWRYSTPADRTMETTPGVSFAPYDPTDPTFQDVPYPWLAVVVMDPYEGQATLPDGSANAPTDDRPYRAWKDFYEAQAIHGVTTYGEGQARTGEYCIKVGIYEDFCWHEKIIPPIEIKVMTGKAPNTVTKTYIVNLTNGYNHPNFGFAYGMDLCYNYTSCCPIDAARNVKYTGSYWQGAVLADPTGDSRELATYYPRPEGVAFADYPANVEENVGWVCNWYDIDVWILVRAPWALGYVNSENMADAVATQVASMYPHFVGQISANGTDQVLSLGNPTATFNAIKAAFTAANPTWEFGFWKYDPFNNTFTLQPEWTEYFDTPPGNSIGYEWADLFEQRARDNNHLYYYWELGKGGWLTKTTTEYRCL